jgi:hypothetical protein
MRGSCSIVSLLGFSSLLPLACGGGTKSEWPKGNVVLEDANNYTATASLTIPVVQTAPGADLMVCWDGVKKDLLCHDVVSPDNGIDNVGFARIPNAAHDKLAMQLAVGQFDTNLVQTYREFHTVAGSSCAMLSQFMLGTVLNPATDYTEPATGQTLSYMLLFSTGLTPAVGVKSMLFLEPTSAKPDVKSVAAVDACDNHVLNFQATLGQPMTISKTDNTKWHVDWSQLTKDSFGFPIDFAKLKVDSVLFGFYQNMTASDLQTGFKDIEQSATTMYQINVPLGARDAQLADGTLRGGTDKFMGFTQTDGVWALAVRCSKCESPAPIVMTILQPQ